MPETSPKQSISTQGRIIVRVINGVLAIYFLGMFLAYMRLVQSGHIGVYNVFSVLMPYWILIGLLLFPIRERLRIYLILLNLYFSIEFLLLLVYGFPYILSTNVFVHMMAVVYLNYPKVRDVYTGIQRSRKILIVDDDRGIHLTMTPVLTAAGFEVASAISGEEGLHLVRTLNPRLVILDVIMPKLKGREVCSQMKADPATKHIPVIFLTAKDSPDDIQAELRVGAVGHLTKPVNPKRLLAEVRRVLEDFV